MTNIPYLSFTFLESGSVIYLNISGLGIHIISIPKLFDLFPSNLALKGTKLTKISTVAFQSGLQFLHKNKVLNKSVRI